MCVCVAVFCVCVCVAVNVLAYATAVHVNAFDGAYSFTSSDLTCCCCCCCSLLFIPVQAYALQSSGVRLIVTNLSSKGKAPETLLATTGGSCSVRDNIMSVFGAATADKLVELSAGTGGAGAAAATTKGAQPPVGDTSTQGTHQSHTKQLCVSAPSTTQHTIIVLSYLRYHGLVVCHGSRETLSPQARVT